MVTYVGPTVRAQQAMPKDLIGECARARSTQKSKPKTERETLTETFMLYRQIKRGDGEVA